MLERRKTHRGRVFFGAAVDFNQRQSVFDCVIRNFSMDGAKIALSSGVPIPENVHLTIRHRGETISARTVWQHHDQAGLAFSRDAQTATVIDFKSRRENITRKIEGFFSDETAGSGVGSLLVIAGGSLVAAGIGQVASLAIETKFNAVIGVLKSHLN